MYKGVLYLQLGGILGIGVGKSGFDSLIVPCIQIKLFFLVICLGVDKGVMSALLVPTSVKLMTVTL